MATAGRYFLSFRLRPLTDPPYLVSHAGRWGSDWEIIQGDSDANWVLPVFAELWRVIA